MATGLPEDNLKAFYEFLGERLQNGGATLTPEQSVREFRAYQEELARFRQTIATAREQGASGLAEPLDVDAHFNRVNQRSESQ